MVFYYGPVKVGLFRKAFNTECCNSLQGKAPRSALAAYPLKEGCSLTLNMKRREGKADWNLTTFAKSPWKLCTSPLAFVNEHYRHKGALAADIASGVIPGKESQGWGSYPPSFGLYLLGTKIRGGTIMDLETAG